MARCRLPTRSRTACRAPSGCRRSGSANSLLAAIYDAAGWSGVIVLTARLLRRRDRAADPFPAAPPRTAAGADRRLGRRRAAAAALCSPVRMSWRCRCWSLWCGALVAARATSERPPPWRLLPVMVLWANLHGSFLFGLALAGLLAGEAVLAARAAAGRGLPRRCRWGGLRAGAAIAAGCADAERHRRRCCSRSG